MMTWQEMNGGFDVGVQLFPQDKHFGEDLEAKLTDSASNTVQVDCR